MATRAKAGRPSGYSDELAEEICRRMADGASLKTVCMAPEMPSLATVMRWLNDESRGAFRDAYARARETRLEHMAEDIVLIADRPAPTITEVQKQRLQVDTRKWVLSKLLPQKYGDMATVRVGNADGEAFKVENNGGQTATRIAMILRAHARGDEALPPLIEQRDGEDLV